MRDDEIVIVHDNPDIAGHDSSENINKLRKKQEMLECQGSTLDKVHQRFTDASIYDSHVYTDQEGRGDNSMLFLQKSKNRIYYSPDSAQNTCKEPDAKIRTVDIRRIFLRNQYL